MAAPAISTRPTLTAPVRVLVADSNEIYAVGAARALESFNGAQIVTVNRIHLAEIRLSQAKFDVVLIDDSLLPFPEYNLKALQAAQTVTIGVFYEILDPEHVAECYRSGVKAIVSRTLSEEALCETLKKLLGGEEVLDRDALEAVLTSIKAGNSGGQRDSDDTALTRKEQKIAYMVANTGKRNKEIAADLSMSEQVVKNHLRSIYAKMKVTSRTQLALKLLRPESAYASALASD